MAEQEWYTLIWADRERSWAKPIDLAPIRHLADLAKKDRSLQRLADQVARSLPTLRRDRR